MIAPLMNKSSSFFKKIYAKMVCVCGHVEKCFGPREENSL